MKFMSDAAIVNATRATVDGPTRALAKHAFHHRMLFGFTFLLGNMVLIVRIAPLTAVQPRREQSAIKLNAAEETRGAAVVIVKCVVLTSARGRYTTMSTRYEDVKVTFVRVGAATNLGVQLSRGVGGSGPLVVSAVVDGLSTPGCT